MKNKHWQFINRYGDNDKHWWRFRYSPVSSGWTPTGIMLETSGGGYDESGRAFNILSVMLRGRTLQLILPEIVKPFRRPLRHPTPQTNEIGKTYYETFRREFGFRCSGGAVHFHYGEQVHEWPGDKSKVWFYPWRETTHIRHSLYDDAGELFATFTDDKMWGDSYEARKAIEAACPVKLFLFAENDGDLRVAQCRIEEREWRYGPHKGLWRWLLAWKPNMVCRSLTIEYSDEVGRRKGSWKGGTIGTGIDMLKDETPYEAFRRHCTKENLHFIGDVTKPAEAVGDLRDDAKRFMEEIASGMTAAFVGVREDIYRAGLVPIFDTVANKTRAYPARAVNAAQHGIILPDSDPIQEKFDGDEISRMMADGQVEGQWGSPMVIRQVSDEEFLRMVEGAAADGTVNAAMHEEFEARGLDTAQIPVVDPTADARKLKEYWRSRDDLIMPPPVQDAGPLESTAMAGCDTGRNSFGVMAEIEGFEKSSDHEK